jgi:hypothetical protein
MPLASETLRNDPGGTLIRNGVGPRSLATATVCEFGVAVVLGDAKLMLDGFAEISVTPSVANDRPLCVMEIDP